MFLFVGLLTYIFLKFIKFLYYILGFFTPKLLQKLILVIGKVFVQQKLR